MDAPITSLLHRTLELTTDVLMHLGACDRCVVHMQSLNVIEELARLQREGGIAKVHASKVLWVVRDRPMLAASAMESPVATRTAVAGMAVVTAVAAAGTLMVVVPLAGEAA